MMKRLAVPLLATLALLAISSLASRADEFTQIQNSPKTYWVPAPAGQAANPQPDYAAAPSPYGYYPPPGYAVAAPPPPPYYYYGPPPPRYYGPPPVAVGYYGGRCGSRVVIGIPGLFFGFHFH